MNHKIGYIFLLLFFGLLAQLPAVAQKATEVLVQNQEAVAVPALRISIQNSDFFTTNRQGKFQLPLANRLRMPIRAELEDDRWEITKVAHYEDKGQLIVYVNRIIQLDEVIAVQVTDTTQQPVADLQLKLEGTTYLTNEAGRIVLPAPQSAYARLQLLGGYQLFNRQTETQSHTLLLTVHPKAPEVVEVVQPGNDPLVKSYEDDFERITVQIGSDRALYEQKNEEIRKEILKIQDKLLRENEITEPQREELRSYLSGLEKNLEENSQAIRVSEQRTREALYKLRDLLVEKDSLNRIALGRIQRIEAEKAAAEASFRQKMMIFAGIILALIAGLGIVYFFAVTYRRQKLWLKEINRRLKHAQDHLTYSLHELNQKKAQIEDHNQQLEVFVYKASHDIKGPLRSIMGLTQIGLSDVQDTTALEYFQHIYKSTRRLDNLLMDLLKLTKVKQAEVDRQPIDLPAMMQDIIQSFSNIRYFDQVKIALNIQEGIQLESDEKLLYSVLQNFVENGIKYCDPYKAQPLLQISIEQNEVETTFIFKDNGLGIPQEQLPRIFDMFYKVDPSSDGTGLGLHIVKLTIEKLGGKLRVRSRERQGSTFILTFAQ